MPRDANGRYNVLDTEFDQDYFNNKSNVWVLSISFYHLN